VFGFITRSRLKADKISSQDMCIVRSYNRSAGTAATSWLWKYDAFPIYIAVKTMQYEIYNNTH